MNHTVATLINSHGLNDNPDPECSYASFVTTCKAYPVYRSKKGDREVACKDTNSCLAEGTSGVNLNEETSWTSWKHGTIEMEAISRGIGMFSREPSRSEETVDVSAPATEYADPKDIHKIGVKDTCNRYTNTGIGKETITCESVGSTANIAGH